VVDGSWQEIGEHHDLECSIDFNGVGVQGSQSFHLLDPVYLSSSSMRSSSIFLTLPWFLLPVFYLCIQAPKMTKYKHKLSLLSEFPGWYQRNWYHDGFFRFTRIHIERIKWCQDCQDFQAVSRHRPFSLNNFLNILLPEGFSIPAWQASRSVSVQISCDKIMESLHLPSHGQADLP
jgi:hypothetical protein